MPDTSRPLAAPARRDDSDASAGTSVASPRGDSEARSRAWRLGGTRDSESTFDPEPGDSGSEARRRIFHIAGVPHPRPSPAHPAPPRASLRALPIHAQAGRSGRRIGRPVLKFLLRTTGPAARIKRGLGRRRDGVCNGTRIRVAWVQILILFMRWLLMGKPGAPEILQRPAPQPGALLFNAPRHERPSANLASTQFAEMSMP